MIYKEQDLVEEEGSNVQGEIDIEISKEKVAVMFGILLDSYKNSRAAILREYVSNAWDAHREINSDEPVMVNLDEDEGGNYLEIVDRGVGMTAEFIATKFSQLLESTKADRNDQIGMWGIGSKCALSYCSSFLLTTIKDGKKNEYLISRVTTGKPKITPMGQTEETDEHSGTRVKIYLYDKYNEIREFGTQAASELSFFDNVVFKFNDRIDSVLYLYQENYNNGIIIEGEHFKVRTSSQYSRMMHLVLGKVCYAIDWNELNMEPIPIPVGIKFEIGDFMVNQTREMITYTDEAKDMIKRKINLVKEELISLYNSQSQPIEDIFEFIKARKAYHNNAKFLLHLEGVNNNGTEVEMKLDITYLKKELNRISFAPIAHLPIHLRKDISPLFFLYLSDKAVIDSRERNKSYVWGIDNMNEANQAIIKLDTGENIPDSKEFRKYIKNCMFLRDNPIKGRGTYNDTLDNLGIKRDKKGYYPEGSGRVAYEYKKIILGEIEKSIGMIDYTTFEIPQAWKDEMKLLAQMNKKHKTQLQGRIHVKTYSIYGSPMSTYMDLSTLNNFYGTIIYGFRDDGEILSQIAKSIHEYCSRSIIKKKPHSDLFKIFQIARANEANLIGKHFKAININDFISFPRPTLFKKDYMESKNSFAVRMLTCRAIETNENYQFLTRRDKSGARNVSYHLDNIINELDNYLDKYILPTNNRIDNHLDKELALYPNKIEPYIKYYLEALDEFMEGVEMLKYVYTTLSVRSEDIAKYLIQNKKKVNLEYYSRPSNAFHKPVLASHYEKPFNIPQLDSLDIEVEEINEQEENEVDIL